MSKQSTIRDEARLFPWDRLFPEQRQLIRDGVDLIGALLNRGDEVRRAQRVEQLDGRARGLVRIEDVRINTTILLEGERGSGKTTVLLHLLAIARSAWLRQSLSAQLDGGEPFISTEGQNGADEVLREVKGWGARVLPLEVVDLDTLPEGRHPAIAIAQRIKPLIPEDEHEEGTAADAWHRFVRAAAIGTQSGGKDRIATLPLEQIPYELEHEAREHLTIGHAWRSLIDAVLLRYPKHEEPLLLLPIDDADLGMRNIGNILQTIRWLAHPRVAFILTGTASLFVSLQQKIFDGLPVDSARALAERAVQKTLPPRQHLKVRALSGRLVIDALASVQLASGRDMKTVLQRYPSLWLGASLQARDLVDGLSDVDPDRIVRSWFAESKVNLEARYLPHYAGEGLKIGMFTIRRQPWIRMAHGGHRLDRQAAATIRLAGVLKAEQPELPVPEIETAGRHGDLVRFRREEGFSSMWPAPVLSPAGHEQLATLWDSHTKSLTTGSTEEDVVTAYLATVLGLFEHTEALSDVGQMMQLLATLRPPEEGSPSDIEAIDEWRRRLPLITLPEAGLSPALANRLARAWGLLDSSSRTWLLEHRPDMGAATTALAELSSPFLMLDLLHPDRHDARLQELLRIFIPRPPRVHGGSFIGGLAVTPGLLTAEQKGALVESLQPIASQLKTLGQSNAAALTATRLMLSRLPSDHHAYLKAEDDAVQIAANLGSLLGPVVAEEGIQQEGFGLRQLTSLAPRAAFKLGTAGDAIALVVHSALIDLADRETIAATANPFVAHAAANAVELKGRSVVVGAPMPRYPSMVDRALMRHWWSRYIELANSFVGVGAGFPNRADNALYAWLGIITRLAANRSSMFDIYGEGIDLAPKESPGRAPEDWHPITAKLVELSKESSGARAAALRAWVDFVPLLAAPEFGGTKEFSQSLLSSLASHALFQPEQLRLRRREWLKACDVESPDKTAAALNSRFPGHPWTVGVEAVVKERVSGAGRAKTESRTQGTVRAKDGAAPRSRATMKTKKAR